MHSMQQARSMQVHQQSHLSGRALAPASRPRLLSVHVRASTVNVEDAKRLVDKDGYKILDVRSARQYDDRHITKPAMSCMSAPLVAGDGSALPAETFLSAVASKFPGKGAKIIVMCQDGGALSDQAMAALSDSAYTGALKLEGGYTGWDAVWSPSGKRRPPPGRWVSTGKEALKSGLNIPGVAESYDEGGNLVVARVAKGLEPGEALPQ